MEKIESRIQLGEPSELEKKEFGSQDMRPEATAVVICSKCGGKSSFRIRPFQTGRGFAELYKNGLLSKAEIIELHVASKPSEHASHLGELLVANLPTLYLRLKCQKCGEDHLIVFGCGEKQPGRWQCHISGAWRITTQED